MSTHETIIFNGVLRCRPNCVFAGQPCGNQYLENSPNSPCPGKIEAIKFSLARSLAALDKEFSISSLQTHCEIPSQEVDDYQPLKYLTRICIPSKSGGNGLVTLASIINGHVTSPFKIPQIAENEIKIH
jgi:hypothetical protein